VTRGNTNALWAESFLDELARVGVRHVCISPGSRSTSLVLAAAGDPRFRLYPVLDERSAGYFAVGIGKATGVPAVVITTSGTAAANLYPAVVEASQGEVPLLVLTADRPHHLRDSDGNQAIDQIRLFGTFPRAFFELSAPRSEAGPLRHLRGLAARAFAAATGPPPGPVHLNFPFEKPFEPDEFQNQGARGSNERPFGRTGSEPAVRVSRGPATLSPDALSRLNGLLDDVRRGVIVAGPVPDARAVGPGVLALGAATGYPVLADPLSGARFTPSQGALVPAGYDVFLRSRGAVARLKPDLILRVGASPTSASLLSFLEGHGNVRQIVVDAGHRWKDHLATSWEYLSVPAEPLFSRLAAGRPPREDPEWTGLWRQAEAACAGLLEEEGFRFPGAAGGDRGDEPVELLEGELLASVAAVLPEDANLLVASSMPIRDLDAFGRPGRTRINVFGNRGASGIDGLISTAAGIAAAAGIGTGAGGRGPTVAVLGDLAFLHDLSGLMTVSGAAPPLVLVVINNQGGGIFHTLPVREYEPAFTRFFATPHGLELDKAAAMFGISYHAAAGLDGFEAGLAAALASGQAAIVEVRTRREENHKRRADLLRAVTERLDKMVWANS